MPVTTQQSSTYTCDNCGKTTDAPDASQTTATVMVQFAGGDIINPTAYPWFCESCTPKLQALMAGKSI